MRRPPISITRPAGVFTVPFGVVDVCPAGVSRTEPQSNSTVPPMLGSNTAWSAPRSSESSPASSTMATTGAPVRLAIATVSPMWSACPCVSRIASAATSSALAAALGLPVRNGSTSTVVPSCSRANAAWPRKRISIASALLLVGMIGRATGAHELVGELEPHRHADEHAEAGFLGDERPHGAGPLLGVLGKGSLGHLGLVGRAEPAALGERLVEDALQPGRGVRDDLLRGVAAIGHWLRTLPAPGRWFLRELPPGQRQAGDHAERASREAGDGAGLGPRKGHEQEDGGDHRGPQQVALVIAVPAAPDDVRHRPRAQQAQRAAVAAER